MGKNLSMKAPFKTKDALIKDAGWYGGVTYIQQFAQFAYGIIVKGILGPVYVGLWSMLNVLLSYLSISQLGTMDAGGKIVPYLMTKGATEEAKKHRSTMAAFSTFLAFVCSLGLLLYLFLNIKSFKPEYKYGLLLIIVLFPLWQFNNAQINLYRYAKRFVLLSKILLIDTLLNIIVGLYLIWKFKIYGQYILFAIVLIVKCVLYWLLAKEDILRIKIKLHWPSLKNLLKNGLPLQTSGISSILLSSVDLIIIAKFLGLEAVGYYSLALTVKNYIYKTPNSFSVVMFPRFQERFAESNDNPKALYSYIEKPILGLVSFYLPIAIGGSFFLVSFIVRQFLTSFMPTLNFLLIFLAGIFFLSLDHMPGQFLITVGKLWQRVILGLISSAILISLTLASSLFFKSLVPIVIAISLSHFISILILLSYSLFQIIKFKEIIIFLLKILLCFAYLMGCIVIIQKVIFIPPFVNLSKDLVLTILSLLAFAFTIMPLLFYSNIKLNIFYRLKAAFLR